MIIDFHTHVFPDKIAEKTIKKLAEAGNTHPYTNGKVSDLKESMQINGIDYSVVLPVLTRPDQFQSVNRFALGINCSEGIISFGGIHPDDIDYVEHLEYIKKLGLKGIKLHPQYQQCYIDDEKYCRIVKYALELGLIVVFHSGHDISMPEINFADVRKLDRMLGIINYDSLINKNIVLAHTGGWQQWDDVEHILVGRDVYFDMSYSLSMISDEQFVRIVNSHGADRILFGSDSPWGDQGKEAESLRKLGLSADKLDKILYKNTISLLNLQL